MSHGWRLFTGLMMLFGLVGCGPGYKAIEMNDEVESLRLSSQGVTPDFKYFFDWREAGHSQGGGKEVLIADDYLSKPDGKCKEDEKYMGPLARTFFATSDERYAQGYYRCFMEFARSNPSDFEFTVTNPQKSFFNYLHAGERTLLWLDHYFYVRSSTSLTTKQQKEMFDVFRKYGELLYKANQCLAMDRSITNLLAQNKLYCGITSFMAPNFKYVALGGNLLLAAVFGKDYGSGAEYKLAIDQIIALSNTVDMNGAETEYSNGYHNKVVDAICRPLWIIDKNQRDIPAKDLAHLKKLLQKMIAFDMYIQKPDGYLPAFNDSGARIDARIPQDLPPVCLDIYPERRDLQAVFKGEGDAKPSYESIGLYYPGQFIMRENWSPDSMYLAVDSGPFGTEAHQHEDKLSFELFAYGQTLIGERGSKYPHGSLEHSRYLLSRNHNTVLVDDAGQFRRSKAESTWTEVEKTNRFISTSDFDYFEGDYMGPYCTKDQVKLDMIGQITFSNLIDKIGNIFRGEFYRRSCLGQTITGVSHKRKIFFVKGGYWILFDLLKSNTPHKYSQMFQFNRPYIDGKMADFADISVDPTTKITHTNNPAGAPNVAVIPLDPTVNAKPFKNNVAPTSSGGEFEAAAIEYSLPSKGGAILGAVLYPYQQSNDLLSVEKVAAGNSGIALKLNFTDRVDYFYLSFDGATNTRQRFADIEFQGEALTVSTTHSGQVVKSAVMNGTYLKKGSQTLFTSSNAQDLAGDTCENNNDCDSQSLCFQEGECKYGFSCVKNNRCVPLCNNNGLCDEWESSSSCSADCR